MDEGGGLENRYTGDCIVGSNPTPSAKFSFRPWAINALSAGQNPRLGDRMFTDCPLTFSLTRLLGTNPSPRRMRRGLLLLAPGRSLGLWRSLNAPAQ